MLDWLLGYVIFGVLFLFSFLIVFDKIQGALLFNMKFAKSLEVRTLAVVARCGARCAPAVGSHAVGGSCVMCTRVRCALAEVGVRSCCSRSVRACTYGLGTSHCRTELPPRSLSFPRPPAPI